MGMSDTKRRGRPPKPAAEKRRATLTLRIRDELRQSLENEAAKNQRSLSEEAEARLERRTREDRLLPDLLEISFGSQLAEMLLSIGKAMRQAGSSAAYISDPKSAGLHWEQNAYAFGQAAIAANVIIDHRRPPGDPTWREHHPTVVLTPEFVAGKKAITVPVGTQVLTPEAVELPINIGRVVGREIVQEEQRLAKQKHKGRHSTAHLGGED